MPDGWTPIRPQRRVKGFFMFWETLWPLILGFGLSGAVQAFVSHEAMQRKLGDHSPLTVGAIRN